MAVPCDDRRDLHRWRDRMDDQLIREQQSRRSAHIRDLEDELYQQYALDMNERRDGVRMHSVGDTRPNSDAFLEYDIPRVRSSRSLTRQPMNPPPPRGLSNRGPSPPRDGVRMHSVGDTRPNSDDFLEYDIPRVRSSRCLTRQPLNPPPPSGLSNRGPSPQLIDRTFDRRALSAHPRGMVHQQNEVMRPRSPPPANHRHRYNNGNGRPINGVSTPMVAFRNEPVMIPYREERDMDMYEIRKVIRDDFSEL